MPTQTLKDYLDNNDVKYVSIMHSLAFTSTDIAKNSHIPSREMAKTVIIKVDDELAMAVVPANIKVDLELLKDALDSDNIKLATEAEFTKRFPDCEVCAMPPFGNLYDMEVFVDEDLTEDKEIAFNAGSHLEVIKMEYKDFENLVKPKFIMLAS